MRILFVASEASPLVKVGGLADVTSSLAIALRDMGHETSIMLPRYRSISARYRDVHEKDITVALGARSEQAKVRETIISEGIPAYLVENNDYFGTDDVYTEDELRRFLFFSISIPQVISHIGLQPDVVHCHDWHTALIPLLLKRAGLRTPVIFTIHNLAYQGAFDEEFLRRSELSSVWEEHMPPGAPRPGLNFLSQGILQADVLTTVSPTYASEILAADPGENITRLLQYRRHDLRGIVNGIDYDVFNPTTDPYLKSNYDYTTVEMRAHNKLTLQRNTALPQDPNTPLFGMVSRLEEQKGIDLVLRAIPSFVAETGAQLVILGQGRDHYHRALSEAALKYPDRVSVSIGHDEKAARLIYGGSDMFLMPSRFEPCGLGQLIAMRYGAVPVVRQTGGLADTVKDMSEQEGNGFVFRDYSVDAMLGAIKRAEESFGDRDAWQDLVAHNMKQDLSWKRSAATYEEIYLQALKKSRLRSL
ncbi:MAG: glycogen synthase [Dehalococcoidia bacterium]